jgi:hypothetical protein
MIPQKEKDNNWFSGFFFFCLEVEFEKCLCCSRISSRDGCGLIHECIRDKVVFKIEFRSESKFDCFFLF